MVVYEFIMQSLLQGLFTPSSRAFEELFLLGIIAGVFTGPPFLMMVWMEAYTGMTPGKWLCGIRTVRTTLRPINFNQALLRTLLLWLDMPLLLWGVPGTTCLIRTERRQRLGDLASDTIVIDRRWGGGDVTPFLSS